MSKGSCFCCISRRGVTDQGLERPLVLTEAEAYGFEKVDEFIGFPLVVVYPGYACVIFGHEVVNGVASDAPSMAATDQRVGFLCHLLFVTKEHLEKGQAESLPDIGC